MSDDEQLFEKWLKLIEDTQISSVPMRLLDKVKIHMLDGTHRIFDITEMSENGNDFEFIEDYVNKFVNDNDDNIDTIDFHLNLKELDKEVEAGSKRLLGD